MEKWKFGIDNNRLIELVLNGKKTATCSIYIENKSDIGEESIIVSDFDEEMCKIKIVNSIIIRFKDVKWNLAKLEGEFDSLKKWKEEHFKFFVSEDYTFNEERKIEFEIFEVIEKYK